MSESQEETRLDLIPRENRTFIAVNKFFNEKSLLNEIKETEADRIDKIVLDKMKVWREMKFEIGKEESYLKKLKEKANFKSIIGSHTEFAQNFVICLDLINSLEDNEGTRDIKKFFNIPEIDQLISEVRSYNSAINKTPYKHRIIQSVDKWKRLLWLPLEKFKVKLHYDKEAVF